MQMIGKWLATVALAAGCATVAAQPSHPERIYLSGTGVDDTKTWEFRCTNGQNSGAWKKIQVPCNWELQGFGDYTYGRWYTVKGARPSDEKGTYRYRFDVPKKWNGQRIQLWFDGVMTDTEVFVNGQSAGDVHQGGFYRFGYDITPLLQFGHRNLLEVKVAKHSSNNSVNAAERKADWWLFGGIYRPVWLEVVPETHLRHFVVDGQQDGTLRTHVELSDRAEGHTLRLSLTDLADGTPQHDASGATSVTVPLTDAVTLAESRWADIQPWTPETPHLYTVRMELCDPTGKTIQTREVRTGFRTLEFFPQDGLYLNGKKLVLKGVNRHSFSVEGGRATSAALSRKDAELIRGMNMNAVRSHYPPDEHFLDMCDSLGLLYLDELAGWHDAYDTKTGEKLLREMLERDVNHPCIVLWGNGNEGGWNTKLDELFAQHDPLQRRHVIHPWADFDDLDTHHYPTYLTGVARLTNGYKVFLPTEFMHAMYDQGGGAGLRDFWDRWSTSPYFAGGVIWAFCDEAPMRTDRGGILDSDGSNAPDGILGPRREKEGSYYAIREQWSPIQIRPFTITSHFDGSFRVTNEYIYTGLGRCRMDYRVLRTPSPLQGSTTTTEIAHGAVALPDAAPGETRTARFDLPERFFDGDMLELEAFGPDGQSICTWSYPIRHAKPYFAREYKAGKPVGTTHAERNGDKIELSNDTLHVTFDATTGMLCGIRKHDGTEIPFNNGPVAVGMKMRYEPTISTLRDTPEGAVYCARYKGGVDSIVWRLTDDGLLHMNALLLNRASGGQGFDDAFMDNEVYNLGLTFSYPETACTGMRWLGRGPYRVWKNRLAGARYGIWHKDYNDTATGADFETLVYPEFKGYHGNLYWATLENPTAPMTIYALSDGIFLRLFTPREPTGGNGKTMPEFPEGDISFLLDIPAIQSFKPIKQQGPNSQPGNIRIKSGDEGLHLDVVFDFRTH